VASTLTDAGAGVALILARFVAFGLGAGAGVGFGGASYARTTNFFWTSLWILPDDSSCGSTRTHFREGKLTDCPDVVVADRGVRVVL